MSFTNSLISLGSVGTVFLVLGYFLQTRVRPAQAPYLWLVQAGSAALFLSAFLFFNMLAIFAIAHNYPGVELSNWISIAMLYSPLALTLLVSLLVEMRHNDGTPYLLAVVVGSALGFSSLNLIAYLIPH